MTEGSWTRRRATAAFALATVVPLAGCGDDGGDSSAPIDDTGDEGNGSFETTETKSRAAGQQSGQQVTNRLEAVSATGQVAEDDTISHVSLTVKKAPGGPNVDLRDVTVSWVESGGTFKLVHDAVGADETDADGRFAVTPFKDPNDSVPVLDEPDDRFTLVFDLGGSTADAVSSADTFGDALEAGEIVTLQLTTRSGSTTNVGRSGTPRWVSNA